MRLEPSLHGSLLSMHSSPRHDISRAAPFSGNLARHSCAAIGRGGLGQRSGQAPDRNRRRFGLVQRLHTQLNLLRLHRCGIDATRRNRKLASTAWRDLRQVFLKFFACDET